MSLGVCPAGYVELPVDKTRCRRPTGSAATVLKICPFGFTIDVSGLCLANAPETVVPTCPAGYFPVPGDSSNCATSTSSTVVTKKCPYGYTLKSNGLCGIGNTYATSGPTYCGPQYTGKNCTHQPQMTPGMTPATGMESGPNMICAFREGDAQYPCDPGCCTGGTGGADGTTGGADGTTGGDGGTGNWFTDVFPTWAIILLIVVGTMLMALLIALAAKKMSRKSRYGNTTS
jgi:hypothetical protein